MRKTSPPLPHWLDQEAQDALQRGVGAQAKACQVTRTLSPPQGGTLRLAAQYGDALVCVRYRRDASGLRRYTTVEFVVEQVLMAGPRADERLFAVDVQGHERALKAALRNRGARPFRGTTTWHVRGAVVKKLGLVDRARPVGPTVKQARQESDGQR
jgi:hypothetical protein